MGERQPDQTRGFCSVDDLVRGLVLLAESGEHLQANIGKPHEMTLLEMAETVIRATGSTSDIVFEALPIDDPQVRQPDITRATQLLGWAPEVELEEGLRWTVESLGATAHPVLHALPSKRQAERTQQSPAKSTGLTATCGVSTADTFAGRIGRRRRDQDYALGS